MMKPYILFKPVVPRGQALRADLGNGYATPTVSGGWQFTQRQRRRSTTDFVGADPISMDIPIVFNGFDDSTSMEYQCNRLFALMMRQVGRDDEPTIIELGNFPAPFSGRRWVIGTVAPGDEIRRQSDGHRIYAEFTVTLLEYASGDVLTKHKTPAKKHHKKHTGGKGKTKIYIVKKGDNLKKIAVHFYGKASDWHEIAKANDLRDPNHLKVGSKLKVPNA